MSDTPDVSALGRTFFVDPKSPGIVRCQQDPTIGYLAGSYAKRMAECLNACAGIGDPAALTAQAERVKELEAAIAPLRGFVHIWTTYREMGMKLSLVSCQQAADDAVEVLDAAARALLEGKPS